jgi:integrase
LRPCEILGLTVDDFDFANKTVSIRQKAWHSELRVLKGKRATTKGLAPEVAEAVRVFLQSTWIWNDKRLLFCNTRSFGPVHQKYLREQVLYKALKRLGYPKRGLHAFRHTAASVVFSQGASLLAASKILGHAPDTDIALLYGHILNAEDIKAANGLATAMFAGAKKRPMSDNVVSRCVREKSQVVENVGT